MLVPDGDFDSSLPFEIDLGQSGEPDALKPSDGNHVDGVRRHIEAEIPYLRRLVRRWHRDPADADDLVQETLLRALSSAHLWQPETSIRAWLGTIMRHQFLTALARNRRASIALGMIETDNRGAANEPELRLTLRDLDRAVSRLPEKQRSALRLAGVEGKSSGEIAALMGLTPDAVRCHLFRARERLRAVMRPSDERTWLRPMVVRVLSLVGSFLCSLEYLV